jgi:SNF family Na+-dependent transporter
MEYYLTPNISTLYNPLVWMDAASQVYFSLGPGFGVLLAFSSYNKFNHNFYKYFITILNIINTITGKLLFFKRDGIITVIVNYLSSFVSGAVIFMYLGYMSEVTKKSIQDVAKEGFYISKYF